MFLKKINTLGRPSRVRSDIGGDYVSVADCMIIKRRPGGRSIVKIYAIGL